MLIENTNKSPSLVICGAVAALGMAFVGNVQADEPNPYYLGVSQAFSHDSNIYRVPTGAQGDTYSSTGLLGGIDQPFGRQHFYANGNVRLNRYNDLDLLNNTSYGLATGLDWSTIGRLSGSLKLNLNENLATYGSTSQTQLVGEKNLETTGQFQAQVQWGLVSRLSVEGIYTHQQLRYSATAYDQYETNQDSASLGLKYRPSGFLTFGIAGRHTKGDYPNVINADGGKYGYDRNDVDLTATWIASGRSTVDGRVSIGKQHYNSNSAQDFSGTTGALSWLYTPTGKLTFNTTLSRDTGTNTSFLYLNNNPTISYSGDNSTLTNLLSVSATYAATGKISVNAAGRYIHRDLQNVVADSSGRSQIEGTDTIRSISLGANYALSRSWLFACNVGYESRSASETIPQYFLSYPYSANTASCSAQFTIR